MVEASSTNTITETELAYVVYNPPPNQGKGEVPICNNKYWEWKPFGCSACNYRTYSKSHAKTHVRDVHNKYKLKKKKGTVIEEKQPMLLDGEPGGLGGTTNHDNNSTFNIRLKPNFRIFISGPSGCGKTHFVGQLLTNLSNFAEKPPKRVIYVFGSWQEKYKELQVYGLVNVFLQGGHELSHRLEVLLKQKPGRSTLIIYDDQMMNKLNLGYITTQFCMGRHSNLSLVFISHNIFEKELRVIRENANYYVLFKNPKGKF